MPVSPPSDQELFDVHAQAMCKAMHVLTGNRRVAEAVVGEVFESFAEDWRATGGDGLSPEVFLYRSAIRKVRSLGEAAPVAAPTRPGEELLAALHELSTEDRETLVLYEWSRATLTQIARMLELTEPLALQRLERARAAFVARAGASSAKRAGGT